MNWKKITIIAALIAIYGTGVYTRIHIWQYFDRQHGGIPFTMESALLFRYADMAAQGKEIPDIDSRAQYPEGVTVRENFSIGKGCLPAILYKTWFHKLLSFQEFMRYFDPAFFCLGIFALYFITLKLTRSSLVGLLMALYYAVSIPAVIRSTGQEFMRENFALPLIFIHMWFFIEAWDRYQPRAGSSEETACIPLLRQGRFYSLASAALLALALSTWDMTQIYLYLLVSFMTIRYLLTGGDEPLIVPYAHLTGFLVVAAIFTPYLRAHGILFSVPFLASYCLLGTWLLFRRYPVSSRVRRLTFLGTLALLIFGSFKLTSYYEHYSHFVQLFLYKLYHLAVKPADPARLPYTVRIMWTPALHSALSDAWKEKPITLFSTMLALSSLPLLYLSISIVKKKAQEAVLYLFYLTAAFLFLYLLFVRLGVFLAFVLPITIGLFGAVHIIKKPALRTSWIVLVALATLLEAHTTYSKIPQWGEAVDYRSLKDLVAWVRENTEEDDVVLADFPLSPSLLTYADRTIVLNPKFESVHMRDKVKNYLFALFEESEKSFYDLCIKYRVDYYVHTRGTYSDKSIYSARYMTDSLAASKKVNAFKFEGFARSLMNFTLPYENMRYRIFKVIQPGEIMQARRYAEEGEEYLEKAMLDESLLAFTKALDLWPNFAKVHLKLGVVYRMMGEKELARQEWYRSREILEVCGYKYE